MGRYLIVMVLSVVSMASIFAQDTLTNEQTKANNELIEAFLPERMYSKVMETHQISLHTIKHILIDPEKLEYSNKLVLVRELRQDEMAKLLQLLLRDSSYKWHAYNVEFIFYPSRQFVLKSTNEPLNVVTNYDNSYISFIGLDGQMVIPIKDELQEFLSQFN